jgi:hypothetical protein
LRRKIEENLINRKKMPLLFLALQNPEPRQKRYKKKRYKKRDPPVIREFSIE